MKGYACINTILQKQGINFKSLKLKTLEEKGMNYVSELSLTNLDNLMIILKWNVEHKIHLFRIGSDIFPRMDMYELEELPNFNIIKNKLENIGNFIKENNIRVSFHPSHFNILSSENPKVVDKTIKELNQHSEIFDLMNLEQSHYYKINIHNNSVGKRTKQESANLFCENFKLLNKGTKKRLTIENDDKSSLFNTVELYEMIYKQINIPIIFDWFHDDIYSCGLSKEECLELVKSTWNNIKPIIHYSNSRKLYEDNKAKNTAHSDYIYNDIELDDFDIMIEAKMKEQTLFKR
jgi:UV DNA damage endonuclease